jgi:hypothetical protein
VSGRVRGAIDAGRAVLTAVGRGCARNTLIGEVWAATSIARIRGA